MPYSMSVAHHNCKINFFIRRTCWPQSVSHVRYAPQVNFLFIPTYIIGIFYIKTDTFIRTDMLATCRMPCPLRTASVYFIYTYLNYLDFYVKIVILLYARTCWPHAVSLVRCAPQVNILFAVYCFICGRRRVAVARYRIIFLVFKHIKIIWIFI